MRLKTQLGCVFKVLMCKPSCNLVSQTPSQESSRVGSMTSDAPEELAFKKTSPVMLLHAGLCEPSVSPFLSVTEPMTPDAEGVPSALSTSVRNVLIPGLLGKLWLVFLC